MTGQQKYGLKLENLNFDRYGIGGETSITKIEFIFDCFQEKLTAKFFKKSKKKTLLWGHFVSFLPKYEQKWIFLEKRALSLPLSKKSEKTKDLFLRKIPNWRTDRQMDGQTDRQTERQTDKGDFIGPSLGRESNK